MSQDTVTSTKAVPYYERSLDSFADHIITFCRQGNNGTWYTRLDTSFRTYVGDPDFSWAARTKETAIEGCARAIRNDARGIGKYAPHALFRDGYDLHNRMAPHWEMKERVEAAGLDPNEFIREVDRVVRQEFPWKLQGEWLNTTAASRMLEAKMRVGFLDLESRLEAGEDETNAIAAVHQEFLRYSKSHFVHASLTDESWEYYDNKLTLYLASRTVLVDEQPAGLRF